MIMVNHSVTKLSQAVAATVNCLLQNLETAQCKKIMEWGSIALEIQVRFLIAFSFCWDSSFMSIQIFNSIQCSASSIIRALIILIYIICLLQIVNFLFFITSSHLDIFWLWLMISHKYHPKLFVFGNIIHLTPSLFLTSVKQCLSFIGSIQLDLSLSFQVKSLSMKLLQNVRQEYIFVWLKTNSLLVHVCI